MPMVRRVLGKDVPIDGLPAGRPRRRTSCRTTTSSPIRIRRSGASCSTMPATAAPTARCTRSIIRCCGRRGATLGFFDLMMVDPQYRPADLYGRQGRRFRHLAARRSLPPVQRRRRRRRAARSAPDPSADLPGGFLAYVPSGGAPDGLHGGAGDRPGRRDRRADRAAVDRRDRQHRHRRAALAAARASARPARPIWSARTSCVRSGAARLLRESRPLLRRAEGRRRLRRGHRRHPALRHAGAAPACRHRGDARRARRRRRRRRDHRLSRRPDARLVGAARDPRREMGAGRQDRQRRGLRADLPAASAT